MGEAWVVRILTRYSKVNWTLVDQGVVSAANFLTALIVARYLGLEAFGVFSIIWLVLLFAQSIQIAFILTPMLSIGPKMGEECVGKYFSSVQPVQLIFAILSAVFVAVGLNNAGGKVGIGAIGEEIVIQMVVLIVATQMHEFYRRYFFARGFPRSALIMDVVRYGVQFMLMFYIFHSGYGSVQNALFIIGASAFFGLFCLVRSFPILEWQPTQMISIITRHWNMSKWLVPSALMQWTSGNFFLIVTGAMLGPSSVGAMRAAQNLMGVTHVFFQAMDNWAPVRASKILLAEGTTGLEEFKRKMHLFMGLGTVVVALVLAVPAKFWLELLYGEQYAAYGWMLAFYGIAYVAIAMNAPYRYVFSASENTKPQFLGYLLATIVSMASVYPLIKFFGVMGALAGFVVTQICLFAVFVWFYRYEK